MAQDIVNKNQDISYTNLDFSTIYTELVDLAKQLSYRWDPSISDESDPGVVLLKLSALLADKMNYNIDKSVLEAFPLSVTQEGSARQLYEQLGYYMNWYESAVVPINFTWIGEKLNAETVYTIPRFTIITDSESSLSYTLIGTYRNNDLIVSDCKLPADGTTVQMIAMEGTPTTYSFLGETKITSQMIDENNRLYFETKYISQNGIFIRNSGNDQDNYSEWKRVDNLYEQPYNGLRYKFGIDSVSDVAYLEFPDNYAELIGSGIEIIYLVIDPEFSNIPTQVLDRFLVNVTPSEASSVVLSIDNVKIENTTPAYGHKNAESINQAYTNYKRTVGTFKTLITLRDYLNYLLLEGEELCSNGFVTDRTNDPQVSYKIMSKVHGTDSLITAVEADDVYESVKINALDFVENEGKYYTYNNNTQESGFRQCSTSDVFNDTEQYFISDTPSGNVYQSIPLGTLTEFELGINYYTYSSVSSSSSAEFTQCTNESMFSPDLKYFTLLDSVYESADDKDFTLEGITKKFKTGVDYYELINNNSTFEITSDTDVDLNKVYFLHKEDIYRTVNISQADFNDNKTLYYYIPSDGEFTFTQVSISTAPDYRVIHEAGQDDDFENVFILNKDHYYVNVGTSEEPQYEACDASSVYDNDKDYAVQEQRVVSEPDSNTQYFTQTVNTRYISVTPTEVEFERNPAKYYTHNSLNHKFTIADTYSSKENYFVQKESDKMTPFSLKFYLLQDAVGVNSRVTFDQTFEMISSDDLPSIDALIEDTSHIEHTYEDILPFGENTYISTTDTNRDSNKSYYKYNSDSGVYEFISDSYYTLTDDMSVLDVIDEDTGRKVKKKYYKYNAQYDYYYEVDTTGIKVPYEYQLYELVTLTDTTDVNPSSMGWYEIDAEALSPHIAYFRAKYPLTLTISTFQVVGVDIQRDIKNNILNAFYEHLNSSQLEFGDKIELDYLTEVVLGADTRIKSVLFDNINYTIEAVYYDYHKQQFISRVLPTNLSLPEYGDEDSVIGYTLAKDVFAKSILAGTTTLLDEDTKFAYHLNQHYITDTGDEGVYSITSEAVIDMNNVSTEISAGSSLAKNYTLKENEVIHLYRPKLTNLNEYATGVHYEYLINTDIEEGQSYQLSKYEYIIFYTTEVDENGVTTGYKGKAYTNGAIIKPSFKMKAQSSQEGLSEYFRTQWQDTILRQSDSVYDCDTYSIYWVSVIQNNASIINNVIQGSNSIIVQKMNTVTITPEDGYKFYWTLNDEQKSENTNKRFYELFQGFDSDSLTDKRNNGTINTYTLKSGETLYYIDKDAKNLAILHEGTTITRNCGTLNDYQEIDSNDLLDYIDYTKVMDDYTFITEYGEVSPRANGFYSRPTLYKADRWNDTVPFTISNSEFYKKENNVYTEQIVNEQTRDVGDLYNIISTLYTGNTFDSDDIYYIKEALTYPDMVGTYKKYIPIPNSTAIHRSNFIALNKTYTLSTDTFDMQGESADDAYMNRLYIPAKVLKFNPSVVKTSSDDTSYEIVKPYFQWNRPLLSEESNEYVVKGAISNKLDDWSSNGDGNTITNEFTIIGIYKDITLVRQDGTGYDQLTGPIYYGNNDDGYASLPNNFTSSDSSFKINTKTEFSNNESIGNYVWVELTCPCDFTYNNVHHTENCSYLVRIALTDIATAGGMKQISHAVSDAVAMKPIVQPNESTEYSVGGVSKSYDEIWISTSDVHTYIPSTYPVSDFSKYVYYTIQEAQFNADDYRIFWKDSNNYLVEAPSGSHSDLYKISKIDDETEEVDEYLIYNTTADQYSVIDVDNIDDALTRSEDPFVVPGKSYYILAMKSTAGLYENINNIYTPCGDTTYDIFEQVALDDELLDSINPHDDGLYEKINYEGYVIEDSYAAKYLDDNDYEGISLSRPRYALSLDNTVFNTQVFTSLPNKFESNDVSKYPESITLDSNTLTTFSPLVNNLYEVNESSDSLGTFYTDNEAHNLAPVEVDSCPVAEGWYEVIDGNVVLSQKMYAYNPVSANRCTETTPFNEIDADGDSQVYSYYYRFSKDNTVYHKTSSSNPYITLSSSAENVPLTLYNICSRILGSNPTDRLTLDAIDNLWSTRTTETLPSGFSVMGFRKLNNNENSDNPYYFISSNVFDVTRADLISSNINNDSPLYCGSIEKTVEGVTTTINGYFLKNVSGIDSVDSDVYTMDDYRIITDTDIQLWYSAVAKLGSSYASYTPIFFIPLYYKLKYLVSLNSTTYYKLKTYATGSYGVIAPWQCDSLSSDYIVNNPSRALTDYWQTIQNNCSITITENDTYSLSEGDTLSIVSSGLSTDNSKIKWPVFSNTEIILNLDNYIISYTRSDHNVTTLDSININGMTWRGYSSLLLNTSDTFGQIVENHHRIAFLDNDKEVLYTIPDDVPEGMNTSKQLIFQLKNPIDNKTGDVISVYTYDSLGNEVPNSMYLFYRIFDTDQVIYNTNYETTLSFTGIPTLEQPLQIELPFNLQSGDYLVPINTISNVHLRCDLNQNVYDKNNFKPVGVIDAWSEGVEYYTYDNQSYTPVSDYISPPNPEVVYYVVDGYSKGTVNVTPITDFAQSTNVFTGDRTYYLSINIPENTTGYDVDYTLVFTSNSEANIVLGDVFKYEPNGILTEVNAYDEILNRVKLLDKNSIYNYTFQPSDNDIIENPLLPESFWNKNHVYNEYTIPQLDLSSADNLYYKFITSR